MFFMMMPNEMSSHLAQAAKSKRLFLNFTQKTLAERSGVSLGVIKKFEHTGKISLESLLKLAMTLSALEDFKDLFKLPEPEEFPSLDAILKNKKRQRGRQ